MFNQKSFNYSRQWFPLPAQLFEIEDEYYIFDSNQVRFLEVSETIFRILSYLKQNKGELKGIKTGISSLSADEIEMGLKQIIEYRESGYFNPMVFQRKIPHEIEKIKETLNSKLKGMLLNVTSRCNMACSYCILGGDYAIHSALKQEDMNWNTAKKAIDFFTSRASTEGIFRVDFFGGEPLLAFPLIEKAASYVNRIFKERNQEVMYSITSNGTISICHLSDTFIIGNVHENTWYFDKIESYHRDRYAGGSCGHCYIRRFCELCYEKMNGADNKRKEQLKNFCRFQRRYFKVIFEYMLRVLKNNPLLWNELNQIAEDTKSNFLAKQQNQGKKE